MSAAVSTPSIPRERPILFSTPMVRAILDGRKTVTRRIVKQIATDARDVTRFPLGRTGMASWAANDAAVHDEGVRRIPCPFAAGMRLWVKETFWQRRIATGSHQHAWGDSRHRDIKYVESTPVRPWQDCTPDEEFVKRPSIFMFRWASRITLEVVDVRVERLHAITEQDAIAEGVSEVGFPRDTFAKLWDEINGDRANWESNPWIWRVGFKRLEC